jgi:tRNA modification GTPase
VIPDDTIAAISTPPGIGGISIVRLSGRDAVSIVASVLRSKHSLLDVPSHSVSYGRVVDPESGKLVDEVLVTVMKAPRTYTREDIVEINCHGGPLPTKKILEIVLQGGARIAEPGEFTKRAFLNGRLDLTQAEAVCDVINARTEKELDSALTQLDGTVSRRLAGLKDRLMDALALLEACVDFPEEGLPSLNRVPEMVSEIEESLGELLRAGEEGRLLSEGVKVSIIGRPNVGKSSLLNALLTEDHAIVTSIPGTTRDALAAWTNIGGYPMRMVDTAGLGIPKDVIESEGQKRTKASIDTADVLLVVLDCSAQLTPDDRRIIKESKGKKAIVVLNKIDRSRPSSLERLKEDLDGCVVLETSATLGNGLERLKEAILAHVTEGLDNHHAPLLTSARQRVALSRCAALMEKAKDALGKPLPPEIVALEVKEAISSLDEITGDKMCPDVLDRVFSRFCVGK